MFIIILGIQDYVTFKGLLSSSYMYSSKYVSSYLYILFIGSGLHVSQVAFG
jgi:hypothetical protein